MTQLQPFYDSVQSIYDEEHSTEFVRLFLDPNLVYSCAYFERPDMTLEEAQIAKLDLALGKCDLRPGQRLLDIGCGWGACALRAAQKFRVNVIGLTLSKRQWEHVGEKRKQLPAGAGHVDARLQGWEEFDEPVDRIITIGAFEHFRRERYPAFFQRCHDVLPGDGCMLLHSIVWYNVSKLDRWGLDVDLEGVQFAKFIRKKIFPGGELSDPDFIIDHAEKAGFEITRQQSLRLHYARTLDTWAENLKSNKEEALAMVSKKVFDKFMRYMTGCAKYFRSGHIDVIQFSLKCR